MSSERRGHERKYVTTGHLPGHFFVVIHDKTYEFTQVQDVSISGMGILIDVDVPHGTEVGLRYDSMDLNIQLKATVVWTEPADDGYFRLGIQFDAVDMNENVMFFMTLREYLDDVDQQFRFG